MGYKRGSRYTTKALGNQQEACTIKQTIAVAHHNAIRCPVICCEAMVIAHTQSMQSIIKVSWIVGFIKIGHQICDP